MQPGHFGETRPATTSFSEHEIMRRLDTVMLRLSSVAA